MTLNQKIALFKSFADSHKQINHFGSGEATGVNFEEITYPVMWVMHDRPIISSNQTKVNFKIALYDLVAADGSNVNEVHSDMLEVSKDLVATFNNLNIDELDELGEVNGQFVSDKFGDDVAGVQLEFALTSDNSGGSCFVPKDLG